MNKTMNSSETVPYSVQMEARDHECDIQGVVNNAHYQHYFEHARHKFLKHQQIDFANLAKEGINLMVQKIEIEYFAPLQAHDQFQVSVSVQAVSKVRYQFIQQLTHCQTGKRMSQAITTVISADPHHKPMRNSPLQRLIV